MTEDTKSAYGMKLGGRRRSWQGPIGYIGEQKKVLVELPVEAHKRFLEISKRKGKSMNRFLVERIIDAIAIDEGKEAYFCKELTTRVVRFKFKGSAIGSDGEPYECSEEDWFRLYRDKFGFEYISESVKGADFWAC